MQKQDSKEKLIEATIVAVYRHGFNDATISRISEIADVSLGTVHHYFESKEDLLDHSMRHLLSIMHNRVIEGAAAAGNSPRAKLWAVIQSVLGDEQSEDKVMMVWQSFWVQAEYDDKLRRLRDIYNRRLHANVRTYMRQLLMEIGASNVDARTASGTMLLTAMIHGVWFSYALKEDVNLDIQSARLLVWECLEMFLSRAREHLAEEEIIVATSASLLSNFSMEVIAKDIAEMEEWRAYAGPGMRIYLPDFRGGKSLPERVRGAAKLIDAGFQPVPHIAARNVKDEAELERIVSGFAAVGAREFLLLGGSETKPLGAYEDSMSVLSSGVLQRHHIKRVGFAGHPEEHPEKSREHMRAALTAKINRAKENKMECYVVTQFCFSTPPLLEFINWMNEKRFQVPVWLGVAGRVNAAKLLKFAAMCGIGRSLSFVKRQFGKSMNLVNYSPEGLLAELAARHAVRRYDFPVGVHFYPFGATADTLALVSAAMVDNTAADLSSSSIT